MNTAVSPYDFGPTWPEVKTGESGGALCVAFFVYPRLRQRLSQRGGIKIQKDVKFHSEIKIIMLGGKRVKLENLTPILTPKERERRKKEIEKRLYDVFIKYA